LYTLAGILLALTASLALAAPEIPKGPLVLTTWLGANLNHPNLRIIEVSVNPGVYERGHIPGAVNFPWHNDSPFAVQKVQKLNFGGFELRVDYPLSAGRAVAILSSK